MINREQVNQSQVSLLVQTAQALVSCLRGQAPASFFDQEPKSLPELDGGAKSAIEMALVQVCNRIDTVMREDGRWNCKTQQQLEKQMTAANKANIALMKAQTERIMEANTPHGKYRPSLTRLPKYWVAFLGDLNDVSAAVVGIGRTPQEALESFDRIFTGQQLSEHTLQWYAELEQNQKYEQWQTMDPTGKGPTSETPLPGENQQGDSGSAGPDDEIGGDQGKPPWHPAG